MWVQSLGREDLLDKGMATHSSILAWKIPWTEEPGWLQPMVLTPSQTQRKQLSTSSECSGINQLQNELLTNNFDLQLELLDVSKSNLGVHLPKVMIWSSEFFSLCNSFVFVCLFFM